MRLPVLFVALLAAACRPVAPPAADRRPPAPVAKAQATPTRLAPGLRPRTIILTYHDVIPRRGPGSVWFDVTVSELRQQLDELARRGASFVSLDQVVAHLRSGAPLPPNPVAITFANNTRGFLRLGYPILRARKIPTTMFVHTGFVGSNAGRPKMTWDELRGLARGGLVEIGSMSVSFPDDLGRLDDARLRREMEDSKAAIAREIGRAPEYFAYPNGEYDARVERAARAAGYEAAFGEKQAPAETSTSLFAINRYVHTKWQTAWRDARR